MPNWPMAYRPKKWSLMVALADSAFLRNTIYFAMLAIWGRSLIKHVSLYNCIEVF